MASVLSPRSISWRAAKLYQKRLCISLLEGLLMMVWNSLGVSVKSVEISLGEDMVVMAARGRNLPLVVASLLS